MEKQVKLTVVFTEEDGGYIVTVPSLPEVVTEGDTLESAKAAAEEAIASALLVRRDLGEPWPDESKSPVRVIERACVHVEPEFPTLVAV